jgi:dephospho-CoA kinase
VWKNALFTGALGSGKSWAAAALAQTYQQIGMLPFARVYETAAVGLPAADDQVSALRAAATARPNGEATG